jgi:hypothetical protein
MYLCLMKNHKLNSRLDRIGMTASTLCAIHCAAVPLLITSLPLLGLGFLANPWVEWSMIILALIIGTSSIGMSYFRVHHNLLPIGMLLTGFLIIILGHAFITGWREAVVVPAGGLLIAFAHFVNYKHSVACQNADHLHLNHIRHEKA